MGGIGIVFDALPQFGGMLQETLPKDAQGVVRKGAAGLFVDAGAPSSPLLCRTCLRARPIASTRNG